MNQTNQKQEIDNNSTIFQESFQKVLDLYKQTWDEFFNRFYYSYEPGWNQNFEEKILERHHYPICRTCLIIFSEEKLMLAIQQLGIELAVCPHWPKEAPKRGVSLIHLCKYILKELQQLHGIVSSVELIVDLSDEQLVHVRTSFQKLSVLVTLYWGYFIYTDAYNTNHSDTLLKLLPTWYRAVRHCDIVLDVRIKSMPFSLLDVLNYLKNEIESINKLTKIAKQAVKGLYSPDNDESIFEELTLNVKRIQSKIINNAKEDWYILEDTRDNPQYLEVLLKDLKYLPNAIRRDRINKIEREICKAYGWTRKQYREYRKTKKIVDELEKKGESIPIELKESLNRLKGQRIDEIHFDHIEPKVFDKIQFKYVSSKKQGFKNNEPDEVIEYIDELTGLKLRLIEYTNQLAPQANSKRALGKFLLTKIEQGEISEYIKTIGKQSFKITKLHQDSGIAIRTIERFLQEFNKYQKNSL